jgi:N-methylhydantoinase B
MILDPMHPMNSGAMLPFHVLAPTGSVVMGAPPTSSSQHAEIATKIATLSLQLFGKMVPERAVGTDGGAAYAYIFGGIDRRPGREGMPFGGVIALGLGWGGTNHADGISFNPSPMWGMTSPEIELTERDVPLIFRSTNGQIDSAGAGQHRAGYANVLMLEPTQGDFAVTINLDSARFTRPGVNGGWNGMTSYIFRVVPDADNRIPQAHGVVPLDHLRPMAGVFDEAGSPDPADGEWARGTEFRTSKLNNLPLVEGDVVLMVPAGGGGNGDPLDRDPAAVRLDVWNEKLSLAAAEKIYGVIVTPDAEGIDEAATVATRDVLREARERGARPAEVSGVKPYPRTVEDLAALTTGHVAVNGAEDER